ncbi:MAG: hypothetical protein ACRCVE_02105 [Plesiomonas sp.]
MNLTEGQLFTIEALNKIDGFVWPEDAELAEVDGGRYVYFYSSDDGIQSAISSNRVKDDDDKRVIHAQVTREQFDSVDGWVRNDGNPPVDDDAIVETIVNGEVDSRPFPADGIEWGNGGCVSHWRYPKKMQPETTKQPSIDELYSQYKERRKITESAKELLAESMEAEDKLLDQIKAWNLEHGFDVRLLDESEEKPGLVITDWRDLRIRDVIWWSGDSNHSEGEYRVFALEISSYEYDHPICVGDDDDNEWIDISSEDWRFIRRP